MTEATAVMVVIGLVFLTICFVLATNRRARNIEVLEKRHRKGIDENIRLHNRMKELRDDPRLTLNHAADLVLGSRLSPLEASELRALSHRVLILIDRAERL